MVDSRQERRDADRARHEAFARADMARRRAAEIAGRVERLTSGGPRTPVLLADCTRHCDDAKARSLEAHERSRRCHERAARAHDLAGAQHDRAAAFYDTTGDAATADFERAAGIRERRAAERERAAAS